MDCKVWHNKVIMKTLTVILVLSMLLIITSCGAGSKRGEDSEPLNTTPLESESTSEQTTTEADFIVPETIPVKENWFLYYEKAYYGTAEGRLLTGTHTIDGVEYTFSEAGALIDGWILIDNARYHFSEEKISKGTVEVEGKTRYFNSDGSMYVGWYTSPDNKTLYYDFESGAAYTGWHTIDEKIYYFDRYGVLYRSTSVNGVKVDENGVATPEAYQAYLESTQQQESGTKPPVDIAALNAELDRILDTYGNSPQNIYDYVHDHYTYKYAIEETLTENAVHMLEYGTGSCYHFAALTYLLFERAGYEVQYVTGLGWQNRSYHCWIIAKFDDGWFYVDSLYVRSAKLTAADLRRIGYVWDEAAYPA